MKELIFHEREVESAKIELALKSDFNLLDAFRMFDVKGTGTCSLNDFVEGLNRNLEVLDFNTDDIFMFFRRVDMTGRGRLNFNEFSSAVLPFSREYAALITDRPDYYLTRGNNFHEFFNADTRYEFQNLWRTIFKAEREIEKIRDQLKTGFSWREAFDWLNRDRDGYVKPKDLRDVLAENGFFATDRELNGLLYRLDRDLDDRVSFKEFMDEMSPKLGRGF